MATQYSTAAIPPSVAALPFLFARPQRADGAWNFQAAMAAAVAAESADCTRRNTRGRLAYLLCELGFQLRRRGGDCDAPLPLSRNEIANALGVSLCRVKRTLALLDLSGVARDHSGGLRVLDWPRLCAICGYVPARLDMSFDDGIDLIAIEAEEEASHRLTAAGDPACFV